MTTSTAGVHHKPGRDGAVISFRDVSKTFAAAGPDARSIGSEVAAVEHADFDVARHEFVAIIGPSGCGKSTLLNLAAGLLHASGGSVVYDGRTLESVNTAVGYLTQGDSMLPWRTALQNVVLPLEIQGVPKAERFERARSALNDVGLAGFEGHRPHQLSGGMRKRALLARTLVYGAETILMDEPFGALDAQLRLILQQQVLSLFHKHPRTILFVTHDLFEAVALADRVVVMSARPGRVVAIEDVPTSRPRDVAQARFDPKVIDLQARLWGYLAADVSAGEDA